MIKLQTQKHPTIFTQKGLVNHQIITINSILRIKIDTTASHKKTAKMLKKQNGINENKKRKSSDRHNKDNKNKRQK